MDSAEPIVPTPEFASTVLGLIESVGLMIDVLGVAVIVVGIVWSIGAWVRDRVKLDDANRVFLNCRHRIGRSIVLGLEILVASDIIHTVAVAETMENVWLLAVMIVVRTFISWTLVLDLEERWPWQPSHRSP